MIFHFPQAKNQTEIREYFMGSNIQGIQLRGERPSYVTISTHELKAYGVDKAWKYFSLQVLPALKKSDPKHVYISAAAGAL